MISNEELERHLLSVPQIEKAVVTGDGYHYHLVVISDVFSGKSLVARQQWVYAQVKEFITSGTLHALTMKTWTKEEWGKQNG